jgi:two-component system, NarL family, invasion response regulator UvrY
MSKKQTSKIILVDDHLVLRDALAKLINDFEGCSVIDKASNGLELMQCLAKNNLKPDIVILDLNMPEMDGYATVEWLKENHPEIKVLILTMYDSELALIRLLRLGVRGFLKKDIHPDNLRIAIQEVTLNDYYYSHTATGILTSFFYKNKDNNSIEKALLNEKEIAFLKLAGTELTYKEIAAKLKMTPRAIDGYRDELFVKLDVKSRIGLAMYAIKNGLITI